MNHKAKTFSHKQLAHWLNEGLDLAKIGFAVFDANGEMLYKNSHCRNLRNCPFHTRSSHRDNVFSRTHITEDVIQIGKQQWTKTIRRVFPDNTSICACVNLSDLKLAEFARSENERKYRLLADNTLDVIWLMDMDLVFSYVNPSVEQMLGFTAEEWIGTTLSDHSTPTEMQRMSRIVAQAMERGEKKPWVLFETELLNKKNTPVPVEILAKFVFDKDNHIVGIQGTTRDIRERKESEATKEELENLLIQSQKSEALGALAGGIAHDFNNILHSVIGFSEICLKKAPVGTDVHDHVGQILKAGLRAKELVLQILTFVRQKEVEIKPVQVKWIAEEAIKLLNASLPRTIKIEKQISNEAYVLADPIQIHQIIMNLCTNASHAMRDNGGVLGVEIETVNFDRHGRQKPQDLTRGECVMMAVSDTGPGLSEAQIAKIFEPYYTTKSPGEGTGIGLSVVKSIINKLNGMIEVSSSPGKGSVFQIYLPATTEAAEAPAISEDMLVGGNERILFVDDEPSIAALGEQILRLMGYQVAAFENSRDAVSWLAEHPNEVDLVISDVTMPGVTGDKLAGFAREVNPKLPVILCTGYSDRITPETARELGVNAFLRKPIARVDLVSAVRSVLDGEVLL